MRDSKLDAERQLQRLPRIDAEMPRPFLPIFDQSGAHRILPDVMPFCIRRLPAAQQPVETSRLPTPRHAHRLPHPAFYRAGQIADRRPPLERHGDKMQMVRHQRRTRNDPSSFQSPRRILKRCQRLSICQHSFPIRNAQSGEIDHRFPIWKQNRNTRRMGHDARLQQKDCRASAPLAGISMLGQTERPPYRSDPLPTMSVNHP